MATEADGVAPDERPRPKYGEYAPPGWSWQPPQEESSAPSAPAEPGGPATQGPTMGGFAGGRNPGRVAHPIDRSWTIVLLVLGVFGAAYNSLSLLGLPSGALRSAQLSAQLMGTTAPTSFTPGPIVPYAIGVGIVLQVALWVWAAWRSTIRMRAGLLSWWVPLVAGVVAFVVVVLAALLTLTSDPALLGYLQHPVPTP